MIRRGVIANNERRLSRAARQIAIPLLLVGISAGFSYGEGLQVAGVVTTLSGQVTVARASPPSALPLRFKDDVYARDRITTAEKSLVRVLLGTKALLTVRELSVLALDEGPERATVSLFDGKVVLGVLHSRMGPREAIEVRTPNAIAAVRGTIFLVEILPAPATGGPPNTLIAVARGVVGVTSLTVPGRPEVRVGPGQTYNVAAGQLRTRRLLISRAHRRINAHRMNSKRRSGRKRSAGRRRPALRNREPWASAGVERRRCSEIRRYRL